MGNRPDNIKNELAYFYKVIKNMDSYDDTKKSKIQKHEIPIEEVIYDEFSNTSDVDKQLFQTSLLGWIELIENESLHKALKSLSIEDQIFISYIVKECKTQQELASKYGINQSSVKNRFDKILRILKNLMSKK
ncbi:MAG: sigma-70 family RNA polymerase sigma factor [Elusimicrobia bacterium]|nr:sigma-70 family RNA polymerase sigma factor [Elusimicrobiota bacterium]